MIVGHGVASVVPDFRPSCWLAGVARSLVGVQGRRVAGLLRGWGARSGRLGRCVGFVVDHVTVYRWVQRFTPLLIDAARPCRHAAGDRWFVDETYAKVAGRWVYLYRAIDQFGQVIDVLVSEKRDLVATRRFFTRALEHGPSPTEVSTDRAPAYPQVLDELLPG